MIALTPRLNFEPVGPHHAPLFHGLDADPKEMGYFPAPLSAGETDTFMARIIAHRARHGFGLEAAFLVAARTFSGYIGLMCVHFLCRITAQEFHPPKPVTGAHYEQD